MQIVRSRLSYFLLFLSLLTPSIVQAQKSFISESFKEYSSEVDQHSQEHDKREWDYRKTRHADIEKWVDLRGGQYVLGYGRDPLTDDLVPFAVYDKTYPIYDGFWKKTLLSTIGINDLNFGNLFNEYEKHSEAKKEKRAQQYVYKVLFDNDGHDFPNDWWKNPSLKWKEGRNPGSAVLAPTRIALSDLEFSHKNLSYSLFEKLYLKACELHGDELSKEEQSRRMKELIDDSEFVLQSNGNYKLVLNHNSHQELAPIKVIDLRGRFASYRRSLGWGIVTQITKQFANALMIPGVSGVAYAILERFFNLVEVIYLTRHAMALNMVMEALDGNPSSPFYGVLTESELHDAITYLRRSSTILSDLIKQGVASKWTVSDNYLQKIEKKRSHALRYLKAHNYTVYPFAHSYYALGVRKNSDGSLEDLKIFSLTKNKYFGHHPHDVVNFLNPRSERIKRNIIEAFMVGLSLMWAPIPTALSVVRIAYKEIFIREIHRRDLVEAGFRSHMNHNRQDLINALQQVGFSAKKADEMVDVAYRLILKREMNPMEIPHENEHLFAHKVDNWIRARSPGYTPVPLDSL